MNQSIQRLTLTSFAIFIIAAAAIAQHEHSGSDKQSEHSHEQHMAALKERGARAMGFDQDKTTHHFILTNDGGLIQVEANDNKDISSRDQIRHHLTMITAMFSNGDFSKPFEVHGQVPPGVEGMTKSRSEIGYRFEETEKGGRIHISTAGAEALKSIHEFLRFQITDHKTGDSLDVKKEN